MGATVSHPQAMPGPRYPRLSTLSGKTHTKTAATWNPVLSSSISTDESEKFHMCVDHQSDSIAEEGSSSEALRVLLKRVNRNSLIFIFDLDDTLIPTEWIRSSYSSMKNVGRNGMDSYKVILEELNARTKHSLIPTVVKALRKAKSISNTVAIVTNARSARWLSVFESMFPEVVALLQEEGIPLIRSCPEGSEPNISRSTEYFFYWMNAKKVKFQGVVDDHMRKMPFAQNRKVDIVSVGDNDFEEYAAMDLAQKKAEHIRLAKIIRCRTGLGPEQFIAQLQEILSAIDLVCVEESPRDVTPIGMHVTYRASGSFPNGSRVYPYPMVAQAHG